MKDVLRKYYVHIFFVLCFILCFYRALKGFCWSDETFYISTTDRFFKGDALMIREWYRTQMSSVICLPFYALYMLIVGSNTGIVLYFRVLFLILSFTVAIVAYRVIKKEYIEGVALSISTLIMFYAHLNITSLSYYMLSLEFLLLALFLLYDYKNTNKNQELIVAGVVFALSVLSLPSLVAVYFIVVATVLVILGVRRFANLPSKIVTVIDEQRFFTIILYTLVGIVIPAALFIGYLLYKASIPDIIAAIPNILIDNEHSYSYGYLVRKFYRSINDVYGRWAYLGYLLIAVCALFQRILKRKSYASIVVFIDALLFIIYAYKSFGHTGYISTALCMFGLPLFFLANKKNYRMFFIFGVGGLSLAMTYSISSSDFLYVISIGHFITAIGCVIFIYDFVMSTLLVKVEEEHIALFSINVDAVKLTNLAALISMLVVLYVCCVTVALRIGNVYRDAPISRLDSRITSGPAKGLYTTREHLDSYDSIIGVLDEYFSDKVNHKNVLFSKILPWGYMYIDDYCAYPTTWRATAYTDEQLDEYYSINSDRKPEIILVLNEEYGSYDACGDVEDDHNPNLDEMGDYLKNYIKSNNMKSIEVKCGVLYTK